MQWGGAFLFPVRGELPESCPEFSLHSASSPWSAQAQIDSCCIRGRLESPESPYFSFNKVWPPRLLPGYRFKKI